MVGRQAERTSTAGSTAVQLHFAVESVSNERELSGDQTVRESRGNGALE